MNIKRFKLPALIVSIGLVLAVIACLLANITHVPTITEHAFNYSITYKLDGETKTVDGVYKCIFDGNDATDDPLYRYYRGEYTINGVTTDSHTYTIAEKDGMELYLVIIFNDSYLMGDTKNESYESFLDAPELEASDAEGNQYGEEDLAPYFDAEIVSYDYPEPIENTFVFNGFSILHVGSMLAMAAVGVLVIAACLIFVKKDEDVTFTTLDPISVIFNVIVTVAAIPLLIIIVAFTQLTMSCDSFIYQAMLCLPVLTAFTVAASIALRRKGFSKSGFVVQFVFPVVFLLYAFIESLYYGIF